MSDMDKRQQYVVGFMFDDYRNTVVLIKKNRPEWQAGKLNGVGGKVEPNEMPTAAMIREFFEETGVQTNREDWIYLCTLKSEKSVIHIFKGENSKYAMAARTTTDEKIGLYDPSILFEVPQIVVPNLHWLLPMAASDENLRVEVYFE